MKRFLTLFLFIFLLAGVYAQAPQRMSYQAVVRNASNSLVANQNVSVRITLLQGSATGAAVYTENHTVLTNANGLMTLEIGGGNATNGTFSSINWANGPFFIKSEIDPEGGINYSVTSVQQLLSVPYALYAATSGNGEGPQGPVGPQGPQGEPGPQGPIGPQGPQGPAGQDGAQGPQGIQGPQGVAGQNGVSPTVTTTTTATGTFVVVTDAAGTHQFFVANGADGAAGPQGPQGIQGETGPAGPQGPQGIAGQNGVSPTITTTTTTNGTFVVVTDVNGNTQFFVPNGVDGATGPQGPQGPQGEPGPAGPQGTPGVSPTVAIQALANGNRVIITSATSIDTFTVWNGATGAQGPQGETGADGPQGPQGLQGATGPQGPQGVQGETGAVGPQGPQGLQGETGPQGPQGIQGPAGQDGFSPVVTITTLDTMRTQVTITSAEFPNGQSFIVKNGSAGSAFVQDQANWLETDASSNSYIQNKPTLFSGDYNDLSNKPTIPQLPTNVSAFTNDAGYISLNAIPVNVSSFTNDVGYLTSYTETDPTIYGWAKAANKPTYNYGEIQNTPNLATVATTGNYNDLSNKPNLATVATTGNYNDLSNKPTIPAAANNATLTIQKNGTSVGSFTANASANKSINITVPTTTSELTNNSGFITSAAVPTNVSQLNNDAGYVSNSNCSTVNICDLYNSLSTLQNTVSTLQNTLTAQQNTIARQDSVINALNNQINPQPNTFSCGTSTVTDHEGNVYNTVQIGDQCWTKENMRCTTSPSTGTTILEYPADSYSYTGKKAYYVNGNANNTSQYGLLYNWCAAVDTFNVQYGETSTNTSYSNAPSVTFSGNRRGICPTGWHVPSNAEWTQLTTYVGSQSEYTCGSNTSYIAKALASTTGWNNSTNTCAVGNAPANNNATGFSAVPADDYDSNGYGIFGFNAFFWSATQFSSNSHYAYYRGLCYSNAYVFSNYSAKYGGYSVRCLRDGGIGGAPANNESGSTNNAGGNSDNSCCNDLGARIDSLQNVISNLQNTVSSQDSVINALNNELHPELSDGEPCPGAATVVDIDGNVYNTVQIGTQCWMKENLRTTRYSDGTTIALGPGMSTAYRYYPNNNANNVATYGYLYNWKAVMGGSSSSTSNPSGVQGICPTGWHVPSDAEWTQLTNYVINQSEYQCKDNSSTNIAKALASITGWSSSNTTCAVGNTPVNNNATGFSGVPAGYYYFESGGYYNFGDGAYYWSATQDMHYGNYAYGRGLNYNNALVSCGFDSKYTGYSVRCLRDGGVAGGGTTPSEPTATVPTVSTTSASQIAQNSAVTGGTVTADGGSAVTERGVCWSTTQNPTVDASHVAKGSGTGSFTTTISNLQAGTTYYVRAYATNSVGTAYGSQISFTTSAASVVGAPCVGAETVTDHEGNVYNTVQIGEQCWTRENMRCTTSPSTGTTILEYPADSYSYTGKKAYYVNGNANNTAQYGLLYNWNAAVDTFNVQYGETSTNTSSSTAPSVTFSGNRRGICPQGWHVPSDEEWTTLTTYVGSQSHFVCGGDHAYIAKALASTAGWDRYTGTSSTGDCYPGYVPSSNNATGFSAVPAGSSYRGGYSNFGYGASFWSATQGSSACDYAIGRYMSDRLAGFGVDPNTKFSGYVVRCLRDGGVAGGGTTPSEPTATVPTVSTTSASLIAQNSAVTGGTVTADGGSAVTERGVCWSTTQNPTVDASHVAKGSGTGSFTTTISNLQAGTTYYVRAYATNSVGTAYGSQISFTTSAASVVGAPCVGAETVTDHEGNVYNTVQIGEQCWTKENLRTTKYSDGTTIALGSTTSESTAYRYYPNNNAGNVATYGYLYNWKAVMRSSSSSTSNPSGVQGICPTGWHVPSNAEWSQLTTYVSGQSEYTCGSSTSYIAKALASTTGWSSSTNTCAVGNAPANNNATGFSAVPAGTYYSGGYYGFGVYAYFWSATQSGSDGAYGLGLGYSYANVASSGNTKYYGFSVRCLRD